MTSSSSQACCTFALTAVAPTPSIVVIARSPIAPTGSWQERTGAPATCTVHAPHCAIPHPNLVPVRPNTSRSTHSSGMSAGTSTVRDSPLTCKVVMGGPWLLDLGELSGRGLQGALLGSQAPQLQAGPDQEDDEGRADRRLQPRGVGARRQRMAGGDAGRGLRECRNHVKEERE